MLILMLFWFFLLALVITYIWWASLAEETKIKLEETLLLVGVLVFFSPIWAGALGLLFYLFYQWPALAVWPATIAVCAAVDVFINWFKTINQRVKAKKSPPVDIYDWFINKFKSH